ncbi:DUF5685 family protein [Nocardia camponoti]|uniref:Regulatory protein n=1 Tax=Nocardia camponoti TaxID=1616106 RepID=A0A917V913_9NOCA|nr:DUF5685 family protein [Nocardia camponoti]GGK52893.1 hypothetical protein GCM10011591_25760 [Nocardia camponoti]
MFGVLKPCVHGAAKYGIDPGDWQAHMCGLCLGLRDGHGQTARAATNTDAVVLSVLTEAQGVSAERRTAGPCALRGMRRASVLAPSSPSVQLAATASLLLGAAKIRDHVVDGDAGRVSRVPMRRVAGGWAASAHASAAGIGLDLAPLVAAIDGQQELEASSRDLDALTGPSQVCASAFFGHSAKLAGRPENVAGLEEIGREVGRIAHVVDAIEDLERDKERGRFNPLVASGTSADEARKLVRDSGSRVGMTARELGLAETPAVRWALLDPLAGLVRRIGHAGGKACRATRHEATAQSAPYQSPPGQRPNRPGPLHASGLILGVYCTGLACCVDHTSPCSGERKDAWGKNCDTCCDGCDCCSNCGDCCDCDCCSCDCSC